MMDYWFNISYMTELIGACLLFLEPVKKRKNFKKIAVFMSVLLIGVTGIFNGIIGIPEPIGVHFLDRKSVV